MPSDSIWSGISGLVLFFLRLAGVTQKECYLVAAESTAKQLLSPRRGFRSVGFFDGDAGIAYALLELYGSTGNETYLHTAFSRLKHATVRSRKIVSPDVFAGHAGLLLGLMMASRGDAPGWLEPAIDACISSLAATVVAGRKGLYWGRAHDVTTGSCGFAHGTAGIGFALRHAMAMRETTDLAWLLSEAHEYEQAMISEDGYCPDVRRGDVFQSLGADATTPAATGALARLRKDEDFPSWCNGISGIGLARLAHSSATTSLFDQKSLRQWMKRCLLVAEERLGVGRCSLCHGAAGELEFVREAAEALNDEETTDRAFLVATKIAKRLLKGERLAGGWLAAGCDDSSLLMGESGVAYCLLRFAADVPSILAPPVPRALEPPIRAWARPLSVRVAALEHLAPRTMSALRERSGEGDTYCWADVEALTALVGGKAGSRTGSFRRRGGHDIRRALDLDMAVLAVERSMDNIALLTYRLFVTARMLTDSLSLLEGSLLGLPAEARFVVCSSSKTRRERFLIAPSPQGARVIPLSAFAHLVLREFITPTRASVAAAACLRGVGRRGASGPEAVEAIHAQILEGIGAGIILCALPDE